MARPQPAAAQVAGGLQEWEEFEATSAARPILGGLGNKDEFRAGYTGGFVGMSFRFFDPATRKRAFYWARTSDTFEGCPIRVRFTWSGITTPAPRREHAFSEDGDRTRKPAG